MPVGPGVTIPLSPFFGVMGVAPPPAWGPITTKEPRVHGGNLDNKEIGEAPRCSCPCTSPGANFSAGDGHGVQGDGEVCVTALEMCLTGHSPDSKGRRCQGPGLKFPRAETKTHYISMGLHEDLDHAMKQALREMIAFIVAAPTCQPADAYQLCSPGGGLPRDADRERREGRARHAAEGFAVLRDRGGARACATASRRFCPQISDRRQKPELVSGRRVGLPYLVSGGRGEHPAMDWTAEAIERLKALWAEGHSTAEIGRRMGISKNAVVGKAHRLSLPARPSPIRRETRWPRRRARRSRVARPPVAPRSTLPPVAPRPSPPRRSRAARAAAPRWCGPSRGCRPTRTCCWPIGEPGQPGFRFCVSDAIAGKPYCPEHASVAYVKARDRREDAA